MDKNVVGKKNSRPGPGASYFSVTKRGQIFMTSLSPIHDVMVTNLRLRIFSKSSQLNKNKKLIIIIFS